MGCPSPQGRPPGRRRRLAPPTSALPGTVAKIEVLRKRAAKRLPLFNPIDATWDSALCSSEDDDTDDEAPPSLKVPHGMTGGPGHPKPGAAYKPRPGIYLNKSRPAATGPGCGAGSSRGSWTSAFS